jgi:hypothetical protein
MMGQVSLEFFDLLALNLMRYDFHTIVMERAQEHNRAAPVAGQ